ncbi:hypothetical protein [Streptomyces sp. CB02115]|nr:hypothetical protein [Streptomyces sp. CB02115]
MNAQLTHRPDRARWRGGGDAVPLPGPVDITLDTEELKNYAR